MRTIAILGKPVKIKVVKIVDRRDPDTIGKWIPEDNQILIKEGLSQDMTNRVLLHESFHAMLSISGMGNLLDDKLEEAICDLSENLLDLNIGGLKK